MPKTVVQKVQIKCPKLNKTVSFNMKEIKALVYENENAAASVKAKVDCKCGETHDIFVCWDFAPKKEE